MTTNIDHVTTMAHLGEAVLALVRESGLLRKKPGRKRGPYKKRGRPRKVAANGAEPKKRDHRAERARWKERPRPEPLPVGQGE